MADRCGYFTYIMEPHGEPGNPLIPVVYEFLEPGWLKRRLSDGRVWTLWYGIGERVAKLEPRVQFCVVPRDQWDEIPLADGSFVLDRSDTRMRRLFGSLLGGDKGLPDL